LRSGAYRGGIVRRRFFSERLAPRQFFGSAADLGARR
jgi:hypothetical protein